VIDRLSATSETARRVLSPKLQPNPSSETGLLVANLEIVHLVKTSVIGLRAAMQRIVPRSVSGLQSLPDAMQETDPRVEISVIGLRAKTLAIVHLARNLAIVRELAASPVAPNAKADTHVDQSVKAE
jgi:hypothetical protein